MIHYRDMIIINCFKLIKDINYNIEHSSEIFKEGEYAFYIALTYFKELSNIDENNIEQIKLKGYMLEQSINNLIKSKSMSHIDIFKRTLFLVINNFIIYYNQNTNYYI